MATPGRLTMVSMSGLRVGHQSLLDLGMRMPGLTKRAAALSQLPPLGLLTLASTIDDAWSIELVSDDGQGSVRDAAERILITQPDVVAFSALTPAADRAAHISVELRKHGVTTALGGLHATASPDTCQPYFDVVARGDGEPLLPQILNDWQTNSLSTRYRSSGTYQLQNSPIPRWDLLEDHVPPRYTLQTMRGCPWSCHFCAASRLLGPARVKPIENIRNELHAIVQRQSRPWLELADDNTFASPRDHEPMLCALQSSGARWFTESDWRIAESPKLLDQIAASGCRQILIGLESQVFRYPGMGGKTADWCRMLEAVDTIQAHGIVVNACFIVGAPGETVASIQRLGDFLETAPFGEIQVTLQTPFPGTSLYDSLKKQHRLLPGDFTRYTLFDVVYQPDRMSPASLQTEFDWLIERVYRPDVQSRRDQTVKRILRCRPQTQHD